MKVQDYNFFWQRIHSFAKDKSFPLRVMFELTYRCNFYCSHCYVPLSYKKRGELNTKEVFSVLDQLKEIGCFYLGFTGGEPFVRKDIREILWYAKRLGFEVIIYTNGSLINKEIAQELSHLRPNKVDITIPAMSNDVFTRISGVKGAKDRVFKAIELLHKKGVNLGFKTCVLKENQGEINQIEDFAHSLGALHRLDNMLSACLDGSKESFKYRGQRMEVVRSTPQVLRKSCNFRESTSATDNLFKCGVGVSQAAITPQGELKMCLMIDYPKYKIRPQSIVHSPQIEEDRRCGISLKEAWRKLKGLVKKIKPDENYQCHRCELKSYCKWCPAKAWLDNKTFTNCDLESKVYAEKRKNELS